MTGYFPKKRFHFVGIGGVGMSGIAEILLNEGHDVSGSDRQASEITDYLESCGATIHIGHKAEYVQAVDYLVYSSAIDHDNPELTTARRLGIPAVRRAEMLAQIVNRRFNLAVAGTHGKTTTSALLSHILIEAGIDPTVIVGGKLQNLKTNARLGGSNYVVTEADEYDRSFLTLFPRLAIVTSLDADHLDIYKDMDDIRQTFLQFMNQTPYDGLVIGNGDDPQLRSLLKGVHSTVITYGLAQDMDVYATDITILSSATEFRVHEMGRDLGKVRIQLPGIHNVKNALAAFAAARAIGVSVDDIRRALPSFDGVGRRFEIRYRSGQTTVVDDYAHHPAEIEAVLNAAKQNTAGNVTAVFQPHLYSRTRDFFGEFARALSSAELVVVSGIYPAREKPINGVSGEMIVRELCNAGHKNAFYVEDKMEIPEFLMSRIEPGDWIIAMGAGDIWQMLDDLIEGLKRRND